MALRRCPSLLFDWTALEAAAECVRHGFPGLASKFGLPIVVASSEKAVVGDSRTTADPCTKNY